MKTMVVNQGSGHICGAACGKSRSTSATVSPSTAKQVNDAVTRAMQSVLARKSEPTLAQQIETELTKKENRGVVAILNEKTNAVATYLEPVPYFATPSRNDGGLPPSDAVSPQVQKLRHRVATLGTELSQAEANNRPATEIMRIKGQLDTARRELDEAESGRKEERRRQRYGAA
jgi:hypothetical protein